MTVQGLDGDIGTVKDVEDHGGGRLFLIVDTGPWIFGKRVSLPAGVITSVDMEHGTVVVRQTKDEVKNAPAHRGGRVEEQAGGQGAQEGALSGYYAEPSPPEPATGAASPESKPPMAAPEPRTPVTSEHEASRETPTAAPEPPAPVSSEHQASPAASAPTPTASPEPPAPVTSEHQASFAASPPTPTASPEPPAPVTSERQAPGDREAKPVASPRESPDGGTQAAATKQSEADDAARGRESPDGGTQAAATKQSEADGAARGREADRMPIARYDALTAAEVVTRLRTLTQRELATVERHEKRGQKRQTILKRIESLREKEPWKGYDDANVQDVTARLADADEDLLRTARDYERRHRNRSGVMSAARKKLAAI